MEHESGETRYEDAVDVAQNENPLEGMLLLDKAVPDPIILKECMSVHPKERLNWDAA